jgi:hypothetical protein
MTNVHRHDAHAQSVRSSLGRIVNRQPALAIRSIDLSATLHQQLQHLKVPALCGVMNCTLAAAVDCIHLHARLTKQRLRGQRGGALSRDAHNLVLHTKAMQR